MTGAKAKAIIINLAGSSNDLFKATLIKTKNCTSTIINRLTENGEEYFVAVPVENYECAESVCERIFWISKYIDMEKIVRRARGKGYNVFTNTSSLPHEYFFSPEKIREYTFEDVKKKITPLNTEDIERIVPKEILPRLINVFGEDLPYLLAAVSIPEDFFKQHGDKDLVVESLENFLLGIRHARLHVFYVEKILLPTSYESIKLVIVFEKLRLTLSMDLNELKIDMENTGDIPYEVIDLAHI